MEDWAPDKEDSTTTEAGEPVKTAEEWLECIKRAKRWVCHRGLSALANMHKVNIVVLKQRFGCRKADMNGRWRREFVIGDEQRNAVPLLPRNDHLLTLKKLRDGKNPWPSERSTDAPQTTWQGRAMARVWLRQAKQHRHKKQHPHQARRRDKQHPHQKHGQTRRSGARKARTRPCREVNRPPEMYRLPVETEQETETQLQRSWPTLANPTLAKPTLANFSTDFGQSWA